MSARARPAPHVSGWERGPRASGQAVARRMVPVGRGRRTVPRRGGGRAASEPGRRSPTVGGQRSRPPAGTQPPSAGCPGSSARRSSVPPGGGPSDARSASPSPPGWQTGHLKLPRSRIRPQRAQRGRRLFPPAIASPIATIRATGNAMNSRNMKKPCSAIASNSPCASMRKWLIPGTFPSAPCQGTPIFLPGALGLPLSCPLPVRGRSMRGRPGPAEILRLVGGFSGYGLGMKMAVIAESRRLDVSLMPPP